MNSRFKSLCLPPADLPDTFTADIDRIRTRSQEMELSSQTSFAYQDAVLEVVARTRNHPFPVLELGVYHGGLSVQLAHLLHIQKRHFICVDISEKMLEITRRQMVSQKVPLDHVTFFQGTVDDFFDSGKRASAVIIDADHGYSATRHDLAATLALNGEALAVIMHDYSLRVLYNQEWRDKGWGYTHVWRAVHDICGKNAPLFPIGTVGNGAHIGDQPSYVADGVHEGVAIFPAQLDAEVFARAASFVACTESVRCRKMLGQVLGGYLPLLPQMMQGTESMLNSQTEMLKLLARMGKNV